MAKIKITQINHVIIILLFLFILTKNESIINNPIIIKGNIYSYNCINPIVVLSNEMLNFYCSGHILVQNITSRAVVDKGLFCTFYLPYILIRSEATNNELSIYSNSNDCLISITNNNCNYLNISTLIPLETKYIGYINETSFTPQGKYQLLDTDEVTGLRCKSNDEKILYGETESINIIFAFLDKKKIIKLVTCEMEDYIICNMLINSVYLCTFICNNQLYINAYAYQTIDAYDNTNCTMKKIFS